MHLVSFEVEEIRGVHVYYSPIHLPHSFRMLLKFMKQLHITYFLKLIYTWIRLRMLLRTMKPDVLHSHYVITYGLLGVLSGFHPHVVTVYGSDLLKIGRFHFLKGFLARYVLMHADAVTCDSEVAYQTMLNMGIDEDRIKLISFGVDVNLFKPRMEKRVWQQ